jgi:hypothetical protein
MVFLNPRSAQSHACLLDKSAEDSAESVGKTKRFSTHNLSISRRRSGKKA